MLSISLQFKILISFMDLICVLLCFLNAYFMYALTLNKSFNFVFVMILSLNVFLFVKVQKENIAMIGI